MRRPGKRYFNPRPRAEGGEVAFGKVPDKLISIHALVQRAAANT